MKKFFSGGVLLVVVIFLVVFGLGLGFLIPFIEFNWLTFSLIMFFCILGVCLMLWFVVRYGRAARKNEYDAILKKYDLQSISYLSTGQHYFGNYKGRRLDIYLSPVNYMSSIGSYNYYSGERFEIYLEENFGSRLTLSTGKYIDNKSLVQKTTGNFLIKAVKKISPKVNLISNNLGLSIYTDDSDWWKTLKEKLNFKKLLEKLIFREPDYQGFPVLQINPKSLKYQITLGVVNQAKIEEILITLSDLAEKIKKIKPSKLLAETETEKLTRVDRKTFYRKKSWLIALILFIFLGIPVIIMVLFFYIIINSEVR